ncbi:MAG: asparagine synthase (glutamine-hydrolyzing) [Blastocatellia bacterium]
MCGICGVVRREPAISGEEDAIDRMRDSLAHRGPDGEGDFAAPHVHLGMRRLSVIDLAGGAQPLFNEDESLVLVANGEIYNYVELRARLRARGHRFATNGDCEVILHLYEEHGPDCVKHLRGMFAFALWDARKRRLLLARDRLGETPLYLVESEGRLAFASELKALLEAGQARFELDPAAIDLYFHYHYVPEPRTPIRGVRKLPAGHLLLVDAEPWRIEERAWWRMEDAPPIEDDPAARIRAELETVSEIIVRSDVPVGVALSGGLDSSAIAALAARKYPGTMNAFSVGYAGQARGDERADARALADHLRIPFHEIELRTEDLVRAFPRLVYWQDDPIADISGFGYYSVMKLAREHGVPVMLQGHGGDELFWGYPWARRAVRETQAKAAMSRAGGGALLDYLRLEAPESRTRMGLFRWARSMAGLRSSWERFRRDRAAPPDQVVFYDLVPDFALAAREAAGIYAAPFLERLDGEGPTALFTIPRPWPEPELLITRLQCETYLLENGVAQGDRLSMASSVELRLPLLDYRLVEVVAGLRKRHDDSRLPPKAWLKAAVADLLPDGVLNRPKRGFTPPVRKWYRALFAAYGELLIDGRLVRAGVLAPAAARELARGAHPLGVTAPLSFKALVLEMWCRNFEV